MHVKWMAAAACVAALLGVTPATAKVFTVTTTGVVWTLAGEVAPGVSYGVDYLGLFGAAGADLRGHQYTATFRVDDQTPGAILTEEAGSYSRVSGDFGASPVHATLTIGAGALGIGDFGGEAYRSIETTGLPVNTVNQISVNATDVGPYDANDFRRVVSLTDGVESSSPFTQTSQFDAPLSYLLGPSDFNVGSFFVYDSGQASNVWHEALLLIPQHIEVQPVASAPEPAAWALLLLGFGAAGAVIRRCRGVVA